MPRNQWIPPSSDLFENAASSSNSRRRDFAKRRDWQRADTVSTSKKAIPTRSPLKEDIAQAIAESERGTAFSSEIVASIMKKRPEKYSTGRARATLSNNVRHHLSSYPQFELCERKKPGRWRLALLSQSHTQFHTVGHARYSRGPVTVPSLVTSSVTAEIDDRLRADTEKASSRDHLGAKWFNPDASTTPEYRQPEVPLNPDLESASGEAFSQLDILAMEYIPALQAGE